MLGTVATVTIITLEIGLTAYNLNKSGALDSVKDKLRAKWYRRAESKRNKRVQNKSPFTIIEAEII